MPLYRVVSMSEIDKNLYANSEEIALAIGKSKRQVDRMANAGEWVSKEEHSRGKNKKKWFLISKLPEKIRPKVWAYKCEQIANKELQNESIDTKTASVNGGDAERTNGPDRSSQIKTTELAVVPSIGRRTEKPSNAVKKGAGANSDIRGGSTDIAVPGVGDSERSGSNVEPDGEGVAGNQLLDVGVGLQHSEIDSSQYPAQQQNINLTDPQKEIHQAVRNIVNYVSGSGLSKDKALAFLNSEYAAGNLSKTLRWSLEHAWEKRRKKVK